MKNSLAFILLGLMLSGCAGSLPPAIVRFELQTPRPFGYLIGDEIRHRIVIQTRQDLRFNPNSLPGQGELNRWLKLKTVDIDSQRGETVVDLTYQVFYAANEVKMLSIPGFTLQFTQAGKLVEQAVPAWPFTLSPLEELAVRKDEAGSRYRRPDALPASLSDRVHWLGFYAGLLAAAPIAGYLAYLYGLFPVWPKRRIFKRLGGRLRELPQSELGQALTLMHHALNELNRRPLFEHTLEAFYAKHPEYRSAAGRIERFFDLSNRVLFGRQAGTAEDWVELQALCRLCREIECCRR